MPQQSWPRTPASATRISDSRERTVHRFINLTLDGVTIGAVYSALALSLVLIWRATRVLNFAQGAMAMFTTYIAVSVIDRGGSYWLALLVALVSGFVLGGLVERVLV